MIFTDIESFMTLKTVFDHYTTNDFCYKSFTLINSISFIDNVDMEMDVEDEKAHSSSDSEEEYESQDEQDQEEIDEICSKANSTVFKDDKATFEAEDSKSLYANLAEDLSQKFTLVPYPCIMQTIEYFYPNMGKVEFILSEFEKHWINYNKDFEGYKKKKKDRKNKERKNKKDKKKHDDITVNPEIMKEINQIEEQLNSTELGLTKDQKKDLKGQLKGLKKQIRIERKEAKKKLKDERKILKEQAKKAKKAERQARKEERDQKRLEETKARSTKDYEDDVFFREVRKEPSIIKQYLKDAKKNLKKATKEDNQEQIEFYQNQIAEYENSLKTKEDEAIMLTYERYNKPEEAATRLDLHGLRKKEAIRLLTKILFIRLEQINKKYGDKEGREPFEFNIVTGRGGHSNGRSVLKPAAKDFLIDQNIEFREFSNGAGYTALL